MFRRPRVSHSMTSWCFGRSLHCPVLSVKGQKSKLPWNAVKRSWGQPSVKTWDDMHEWRGVSVEDFDGADDGESTTILQASGWGVCCDKKEVQLSQRATDRRRWSGTAPACNRLSESILLLFLKPLIWQRVCRCVLFFSGNLAVWNRCISGWLSLVYLVWFTAIHVNYILASKVCNSSYYCENVISLDIFLYSVVVVAFFLFFFFSLFY